MQKNYILFASLLQPIFASAALFHISLTIVVAPESKRSHEEIKETDSATKKSLLAKKWAETKKKPISALKTSF